MNQISGMFKKPLVAGLVALIVGFGLGLLWGWQVQPVTWTDAPPSLLNADYQTEYLRMTIDSLRVNGDQDLAIKRYKAIGVNAPQRLDEIIADPKGQDVAILRIFKQMVKNVDTGQPATPEANQEPTDTGLPWGTIIISVIVIVLLVFLVAFGRYLFKPRARGGEMTPAQQAQELSKNVERTDYAAQGSEPPIAQFVTTYVLGDDLFDDSFSIDSPAGEFLGECGVGISDIIGVGDPKKVTAFEVWMFDKNDIQTVTKVFMSAHAFNEPALRAKLESKGELIPIEQKQVVLDTATLQMVASISDMQYGSGALPNSSYFDRMTLELAIWPKK
jgi:hypothetical protein